MNADELWETTMDPTRRVLKQVAIEDAIEAAQQIALSLETVIAVTGERDLVTDGRRSLIMSGGHELMRSVTGTGCAASVIVAAFLAEEHDAVTATAAGLAFFKLVAERAAAEASAPGTFWVKVLDHLHLITPEELSTRARISRI